MKSKQRPQRRPFMWMDTGRKDVGPKRIVCLTEEPTEVLYALREQHRIVGISGFTVRPPKARKEKPKVSAFTSAKIDEIVKLEPDLVIGFSDIQAGIAQALIAAGIEVWISNHRTISGICEYIRRLGAIVDASDFADRVLLLTLVDLQTIEDAAALYDRRPKVYFEEWDSPMISGIHWVSELIGVAGGDDIFPERAVKPLARDRIVADPNEVIERAPDIILGSWCGKRFRPEKVMAREGWSEIPAVRNGQIFEVKSPIILQPGLAALTDGVAAIHRVIAAWQLRYG